MDYRINVQNASSAAAIPTTKELKQWVKTALAKKIPHAEITVRIVDKEEIRQLNATYRHKDKPTNVLSFPFEELKGVKTKFPFLGDIVICADIVKEEALEQGKEEKSHWAHMTIHGVLHLLGYDHEMDGDAEKMEKEEQMLLNILGYPDPYDMKQKVNQHG